MAAWLFLATLLLTFLGLTAVTFCIRTLHPDRSVLAVVGDVPASKSTRRPA